MIFSIWHIYQSSLGYYILSSWVDKDVWYWRRVIIYWRLGLIKVCDIEEEMLYTYPLYIDLLRSWIALLNCLSISAVWITSAVVIYGIKSVTKDFHFCFFFDVVAACLAGVATIFHFIRMRQLPEDCLNERLISAK